MSLPPLRSRVIKLYKELLFLGRDLPPSMHFTARLRAGFRKNAALTQPEEIEQAIEKGEYIKREIETLYFLKKYRSIKRNYDL
ncbi:hypothetical protein RI367_000699 [Sorochytrium milnesiophthora]